MVAFSQQLGRVDFGTAWFEAQHHPARLERGRIEGEQMAMEKTAQTIANNGPLLTLPLTTTAPRQADELWPSGGGNRVGWAAMTRNIIQVPLKRWDWR